MQSRTPSDESVTASNSASESPDGGIMMNAQTMALMQEKLEEKWEREQAEEEREERLYDQPIGPEKRRSFADDKAYYDFHGGVSEGDILEWHDGEVSEVIAVFDAYGRAEEEPDGEVIHYRVLEEIPDADEYKIVNRVGDQNDIRDYSIGDSIEDGRLEVRNGGRN